MNTPNFPLGPPTNRKAPEPAMQRIAGRPDWWLDAKGIEHYIAPVGPPASPDHSGGTR